MKETRREFLKRYIMIQFKISPNYKDRCGYRPGLPFLIISPYAKVIRFIEDNWGLNHIGSQSLDIKAGTLLNMFDFTSGYYAKRLFFDPCTGLVKRQHYRL
jgi:phospholipase C